MRAGVVGATGYLGAELLRLLADHPDIDVTVAQGDATAGAAIADEYPSLARAYRGLMVGRVDTEALEGLDVVFVAVPSGGSQEIVAALHRRARLVVDLGADFRLREPSLYYQWYGFDHRHPDLLAEAVYGLPELNRSALAGARLVAAPGCYVTAACLALAPFLDGGYVEAGGIIVDATSGTSGARGPGPISTTPS